MKVLNLIALVFLAITVSNCKGKKRETTDSEIINEEKKAVEFSSEKKEKIKIIKISLSPKNDSSVSGYVTFTETEGGMVTMIANITGLTEGEHAIHIHEKSDCSSADGTSTGGHWNPTMEPHGKWGAREGYHKGDIGNFNASSDGKASINFSTNDWCIGCDNDRKNVVGKAIIVHQGVDDYISQPSGAAGSRISCGGIIQ